MVSFTEPVVGGALSLSLVNGVILCALFGAALQGRAATINLSCSDFAPISAGHVYVTDGNNDRVEEFSASGQ
ncbi:MAG: hypothetical protein M1118_09325 [Chloroflexi bacterium]|nr:hypothetical protein [Chloroflexota bacterium]